MEKRRCAACGKTFRPCPRVRDQKYCGDADCRRCRRRVWQRAKRHSDCDYRDNQAQAQRGWARGHGDYWRAYRSEHPQYVEENRRQTRQRQRDCRRAGRASAFAKMDSIGSFSPVPSGTYLLVAQGAEAFAKMDSIMVEITLLSKT